MTTIAAADARLTKIIGELLEHDATLQQVTEAVERACIKQALEQTGHSVTRASAKLGVHRNTVTNKLRRFLSDEEITQHAIAVRARLRKEMRRNKRRWGR